MEPNNDLNQPNWEKVLAVLNNKLPGEGANLTSAELELLEELRLIKTAGRTYDNSNTFNTAKRWQQIVEVVGGAKPSVRPLYRTWYFAAAATILVLISISLFIFRGQRDIELNNQAQAKVILPGSNKATLTLANGEKIYLSDSTNGQVATQLGVVITQSDDGKLAYSEQTANFSKPQTTNYNTIETPRGGQFQLSLPDGSKVWLNSGTRLTYPTSFAGLHERRLLLTGEAYFEVAHKSNQPFRVVTGSQITENIGTQFNIEAYTDKDLIRTTLTEGAIKVQDHGKSLRLSPGQMVENKAGKLTLQQADGVRATAWKEGYFVFANQNIQELMADLSRWYDIEVAYQGDLSDLRFHGNYLRSRSLNKLLKAIEKTSQVTFKIEERKVTVIAK